jgi:FkbM family methyltransferase
LLALTGQQMITRSNFVSVGSKLLLLLVLVEGKMFWNNRRIRILRFWFGAGRRRVAFAELLKFLMKPKVKTIAEKHLSFIIEENNFLKITFRFLDDPLFWPLQFDMKGLYQVTAETFDVTDWHYYQIPNTVVKSGNVVVDVGAAEGIFALTVVDKAAEIFLLEPNQSFIASLRKTFSEYENKVRIVNVAISDGEGKTSISDDGICSTIEEGSGNIQVTSLDSLFGNKKKIDYLKADVEGYEMKMLLGGRETIQYSKPKMAITCYHEGNNPEEMIRFILDLVPEYNVKRKGIEHSEGKPVMLHFWIENR